MSGNLCSICFENPAKYTCPSCNAQTCSVTCVKRHKLHSECSGHPDPTRFVPFNELKSNSALVNRDYNYLLNLERKISLAKQDIKDGARNVFRRYNSQTRTKMYQRLNGNHTGLDKRLSLIDKVFPHKPARSIHRRNTLVILLPQGMSRSTQNKTGYDKKSGDFTWTVDWVPVNKNGEPLKDFTSFRLKEDQLLKEALPLTVLTKLLEIQTLKADEFLFYLENCLKTQDRFRSLIPLDPEQSLGDNLKDKVVLEYPRIVVVHGQEVWAKFVQTEKEIFSEEEGSESEHSSSTDLDSSSDDSSSSLNLDSDEGPEELSSKPEVEINENSVL